LYQPSYDRHQFAGGKRPDFARAGLDKEDFFFLSNGHNGGMQIKRRVAQRERRLPRPDWAVDDAKLQEVVLRFCERRLCIAKKQFGSYKFPTHLTHQERRECIRREELRRAETMLRPTLLRIRERLKGELSRETRRALEIQFQNVDSAIMTARRGNAAIATAIVYFYYRLGWDSTPVAEQLHLKPPLVRQTLARLFNAATGIIYMAPRDREVQAFRQEIEQIQRAALRRAANLGALAYMEAEELQRDQRRVISEQAKKVKRRLKTGRYFRRKWSGDRIRLISLRRQEGASWQAIADELDVKCAQSLIDGYAFYLKNAHRLPDYTETKSKRIKESWARQRAEAAAAA